MIKMPNETIKILPKSGVYSKSDALIQISYDFQKGFGWSLSDYAKQFTWSRNKVRLLIKKWTVKGHLKGHTKPTVCNSSQPATDTQKDSKRTHKMQIYIAEKYEQVPRLKLQLTGEQCNDLLSKYTKEVIIEKLDNMENKKDLLNKYSSVYRTLISWLKKDNVGNDSVTDRADKLLQYCKKFHPGDNEGLIAMIKASKVNKEIKAYALAKC